MQVTGDGVIDPEQVWTALELDYDRALPDIRHGRLLEGQWAIGGISGRNWSSWF